MLNALDRIRSSPESKANFREAAVASVLYILNFASPNSALLNTVFTLFQTIGGEWISELAQKTYHQLFNESGEFNEDIANALAVAIAEPAHQLQVEWEATPYHSHLQRTEQAQALAGISTLFEILQTQFTDVLLNLNNHDLDTELASSILRPGQLTTATNELLTQILTELSSLLDDDQFRHFLFTRIPSLAEQWLYNFNSFIKGNSEESGS